MTHLKGGSLHVELIAAIRLTIASDALNAILNDGLGAPNSTLEAHKQEVPNCEFFIIEEVIKGSVKLTTYFLKR